MNRSTNRRRSRGNSKKAGNRNVQRSILFSTTFRGGFPDRARVILKYSENVALTATGGIFANYVFRGNSVFDPNVTGTGTQPYNYDDWAIQYSRYRVHGSRISVIAVSNGSTNQTLTSQYVLSARHSSTNAGSYDDALAAPYARSWIAGAISSYNVSRKHSMSASTAEFLGITKAGFYGDSELTAAVTNNPSHQWYWHIGNHPINSTDTVASFLAVEIDYDVEFWDRTETTLDSRLNVLRQSFERRERLRSLKSAERKDVKDEKYLTLNSLRSQETRQAMSLSDASGKKSERSEGRKPESLPDWERVSVNGSGQVVGESEFERRNTRYPDVTSQDAQLYRSQLP
jgi:hypothetical protein